MIYPTRSSFFFFNDTATTEIYTLSLHDALPICKLNDSSPRPEKGSMSACRVVPYTSDYSSPVAGWFPTKPMEDRKSTRLNSSHLVISYAVFCLKKKNTLKSNVNDTLHDPWVIHY